MGIGWMVIGAVTLLIACICIVTPGEDEKRREDREQEQFLSARRR